MPFSSHLHTRALRQQYNHTNHQYEIKLDRNSQLERMPEDQDTAAIPAVNYNVGFGC